MCNLYRMDKSAVEVARLFNTGSVSSNVASEVFPGYSGLVFDGNALRSMTWGFPLVTKGKSGQLLKPKPVNNTRTDKLNSPFWRASFRERRCLIPLTAFAEAEGPKGAKTRTWFSLPDQPIFTCAGIWRDSAEWGPVYSMVMTEACMHVQGVHDRMPVIIPAERRERWQKGSPDDVLALCGPYRGEMAVDRTEQRWVPASSG